jgi:hypothetical protein
VLYGYRFREDYYVSGGGGYVLTRKGLELFGSYVNDNSMYSRCNSTMEDMMVGACLKTIFQLVPTDETKDLTIVGESIDDQGRERFHPLGYRVHFKGPANKHKREWIHFRPFHHNLFVCFFFFLVSLLIFYLHRVLMLLVKQPLVFIIYCLMICIKWIHLFIKFDNSIKKFV